jgi:hypothetical protein
VASDDKPAAVDEDAMAGDGGPVSDLADFFDISEPVGMVPASDQVPPCEDSGEKPNEQVFKRRIRITFLFVRRVSLVEIFIPFHFRRRLWIKR